MSLENVMDLIWGDEPIKALELVETIKGQEARELQKKIEKKLDHIINPSKYIKKYKDDPMGWRPENMWNPRYEWVWNYIVNSNAKSYLDIGCYEGTLVLKAAHDLNIKTVGVELCTEACKWNTSRIKKGFNATFINLPLEEYTDDNKYDVVACMEVIEHVKEPKVIIDLMKSVMHENSIGLITTPKGCLDLQNTIKIWNDTNEEVVFDHVRTYQVNTLRKEINSSFVEVKEVEKELYAMFRL